MSRRRPLVVILLVVMALAGCRDALGIDDPETVELGAICTGAGGGDGALCSPRAPLCLPRTSTTFACTASCGTGSAGTGSEPPTPPPEGDLLCSIPSSSGTPACLLYGEASNGVVPWYCVILCGTSNGTDFGVCPPGLTCTANSCQ